MIVLEEEVVPTTDFLHYMSQCLPVLDNDESLIGATAWNENGQFSGLLGHCYASELVSVLCDFAEF